MSSPPHKHYKENRHDDITHGPGIWQQTLLPLPRDEMRNVVVLREEALQVFTVVLVVTLRKKEILNVIQYQVLI